MTDMFTVAVSRPLAVGDVVAMFAELIPPGLPIVVQAAGADVPDDVGSLWARLEPTEDPVWPLDLVMWVHECDLGPYPDLRVAELLAERFGVDVLCGVDPAVVDVDPHDPFYSLALIGGRWYLASTAGTRLMGPYTDGIREEPGDEPVKLIRPVVVETH